ncbi:hypothetical protein GF319_06565, partial [Candidatus Bathyarchaeota archaeon]|nr:hypothetical protein [Candidatus Bathyarchaeota archaeon]
MKRSQIVVGIIFIALIGLFVVNWYYGEKVEQVVVKKLNNLETEKPISIDYEKMSVNPLRGITVVNNLVIRDEHKELNYKFRELEVGLSLQEVRKFLEEGWLDQVDNLALAGQDIVIERRDGKIKVEDLY